MLRSVLIGAALTGIIIGTSALASNVDGWLIASGVATGVLGFCVDRWRVQRTQNL